MILETFWDFEFPNVAARLILIQRNVWWVYWEGEIRVGVSSESVR